MTEVPEYTYRVATDNDHTDILAVLEEVAPEVPVKLDQDATKTIIAECCSGGESWVAVDDGGTVVGFALVKPDVFERAIHKNNDLSLRYVGVSKQSRRGGVFTALMKNMLATKSAPLNASVLHGNKSAMADRLTKIGFVKGEADAKETKFRWTPAPTAGPV